MPRVTYNGPHDEVEIASTGQTCKRGESVDVPADVAKSLTEQAVWTAVSKKES